MKGPVRRNELETIAGNTKDSGERFDLFSWGYVYEAYVRNPVVAGERWPESSFKSGLRFSRVLPVLFVCSFVQEVLKTVPQTSVPNAHNAKPPGFPLAFWTDKAYKIQCLRMFKARRFVVLRLIGFWGLSSWIFGSKVPSLLGGTWPIDLMGCLVFENYNIRKIGTHELVVRISQEFLIEDLNCNGLSPPI